MDKITLETQIDANITMQTAAGSVSQVIVGTELKAIVDYIGQFGQANVIEFPELSIAHTNTVADAYAGVFSLTSISGSGIGAAASGGNLVLTPAQPVWSTLNFPAQSVNMNVYSNVLASDMTGSGQSNQIFIEFHNAYLTNSTTASTGARQTVTFGSTGVIAGTGGANQVGVLNSPPLVDDTATLYAVATADTTGNPVAAYNMGLIGTTGAFSRFYFSFRIAIPASAITKTYKFKLFLSFQ